MSQNVNKLIRTDYPERIVQFGGGNFLRAFVDWIVDVLNDNADFNSGVVIVKATPGGSYADIDTQNGRFHTRLHGLVDGELITETRLIKCVRRTIHSYNDYDVYLAVARQPEIRFIVSNTTEAGIVHDPEDKPEDRPPSSFPAKLTTFLYERYQHFAGDPAKGCIILPCELIENNATRLHEIILQYADEWTLEDGFKAWLNDHNTFCNTLVDRIVTGYPAEGGEAVSKMVGWDDQLLVEGERYHNWIIEGPTWVNDEVPFHKTDLNVSVVKDLTPYRELKVHMLNAPHTTIVPIGYFLGLETVRDAVEHPLLGALVRKLLFDEVVPILDLPEETLRTFGEDVITRFRNPFLHHRLMSIALNSLSKYRARLLPIILKHVNAGKPLPEVPVFALTGLIRFYKGQWQDEDIPLNDDPDQTAWIQSQWRDIKSTDALVKAILGNTNLWGQDLNVINGLPERVSTYLRQIDTDGIESALQSALDFNNSPTAR